MFGPQLRKEWRRRTGADKQRRKRAEREEGNGGRDRIIYGRRDWKEKG